MEPLRPVALYLLAMASMIGGLYIPRPWRVTLVGPVWSVLALSFWDIDKLPAALGLNVQLGMLNIITFLYCPILFSSFEGRLDLIKGGWVFGNLPAAYRLFNNPRGIPMPPAQSSGTPPSSSHTPRANGSGRLVFAARCLLQGCAIIACRWIRDLILAPHLSTYTLVDFSPSREWLIPRLLSGHVTSHELGVRAYVSLSWVAETYAQLTLLHLVLAVFFVTILQVDEPKEWPPLFASPFEAYSLRRFWGRFWHRLITPSASAWARFLISSGPPLASILRRHRSVATVFTAWFIFTVSGVAHLLVGWRLGDVALMRDVYFFWANFVAIGCEIILLQVVGKISKGVSDWQGKSSRSIRWAEGFGKALGYAWVVSWFMLTIPHVLYPKMYDGILRALFPKV